MPNRNLISLSLVLLAVVYAAISQGNGPAYLPAYTLFAILLVSWMHNRANVQFVEITVSPSAHGFAGNLLLVPFKLRNLRSRSKFGLSLSTPEGGTATVGRLDTTVAGKISVPATTRGSYHLTEATVATIFPFGVFRAASTQAVNCRYLIYPEACGDAPLPEKSGLSTPQKTGRRTSGDDFSGVRYYMVGESQRHVDWKAVARGMPMMVKQFENTARDELWLDFQSLPNADVEARLSQLAQWIVNCERAGHRYGLRLPGTRLDPAQGDLHYHRCLTALAIFGKNGTPERPSSNQPPK